MTCVDITKRKQIEEALRESEEKYRRVVENANQGILIAQDGMIKFSNPIMSEITGYSQEELYSRPFVEFIQPDDREMVAGRHLGRLQGKEFPHIYEFRIVDKDGNIKWVELNATFIAWEGRPASLSFLSDITERKQMSEELQENERRYRLLAENVTDTIWTTDMNLRFTFVSPSVMRISGYHVEEFMSKTLEQVLTPTSFSVAMKTFAEETGIEELEEKDLCRSRTLELEMICKDRSKVWTEVRVSFLRDSRNRAIGILGVSRDITKRKSAEKTLLESEERLRFLSSSLLAAQETELKRISGELHDELGQVLIALKLRLGSIQRKLRKDQEASKEECESAQRDIQQIIESVRRLSRGLRPNILEEIGLSAALRRLVDDLIKHTKLTASLKMANIDNSLSENTQLIIYRIFQEALTNVSKHAEASRISVTISKKDDVLTFLIKDNGKGFDMKQTMTKDFTERGMGLAAMEERTRMLRGSLSIWSQVGKGTRIRFSVPVNKEGI